MRKVRIITDSCADLTPELMEKYGIDYGRMNTVYNGEVKVADLSWSAEEAHGFYDIIRNGERITTTQVPPEEFDRVFRKYLSLGEDVIYISCSHKQTNSIFTAERQAEELKKEFPDAQIRCIDSLHASVGEGMIAIGGAKLAMEGKNIDEVESGILELVRTTNEFLTVHSLEYLKRAGRIKATSAFFGNLMGVKPIIIANTEGEQAAVMKVKGRATSFKTIISLLKAALSGEDGNGTGDGSDFNGREIYIAHADCRAEELDALRGMILAEMPGSVLTTLMMGPIIGASVGPDAVAIFGVGRPIRDEL